jgi:hypothetical protein
MNIQVKQVIDNLYQAAADIEKQDRQLATDRLISIKGTITHYTEIAKKYKEESERWQKDTNAAVSNLILQKSKVHDDCLQSEKKLQGANAAKNTLKQSLKTALQAQQDYQSQRAAYQRKREAAITKKNKKLSTGEVFALIFTLGLYYIKIDKDIKDAERDIRNADDHIRQLDAEINRLTNELGKLNSEARVYLEDIDRKKAEIGRLSFSEFKLQNQEVIEKKKVVYFTEINLFCSRVQRMLDSVDTQISLIFDIIELLDNKTPTIESLTYSGGNSITLKQAILDFGNYIDNNIPLKSFDSGLIENQSYYIVNEWKAIKFALTYSDNGMGGVSIAEKSGGTNQLWKFKTCDNGLYNLTITTGKGEKYLTRNANGGLVISSGDGNKPGQQWIIEQESGYFRLYANYDSGFGFAGAAKVPSWREAESRPGSLGTASRSVNCGSEKSLECSFRTEGKPQFFESEDIDYQRWLFLPDASINEQSFNIPSPTKSKILFIIQSKSDSTMCLDVCGNKTENGSDIILHDFLGGDNQKWSLLDAGDEYYYLEPQHAPGKVLDVYGNESTNGARIVVHDKNTGDNQKWKIIPSNVEPNMFVLSPKNAPNSCLDVCAGKTDNATKIILHSKKGNNENKNQLWYFYKVS